MRRPNMRLLSIVAFEKSAEVWFGTSFADLRYDPSGTNLVFTMKDDTVRQVKLADYF
jgi:hypothetical protein